MDLLLGEKVLIKDIEVCDTSMKRGIGLMFRKSLAADEGMLFPLSSLMQNRSGLGNSIHTMFMRFPILVLWVDAGDVVVHTELLAPWRQGSSPICAKYIVELHPSKQQDVKVGTKLALIG